MTNETAFNTIVTILSLNLVSVELNSDVRQALVVAVSALEKQIPKKLSVPEVERYTYQYICPQCGCPLEEAYPVLHCPDCGQALDWGENK